MKVLLNNSSYICNQYFPKKLLVCRWKISYSNVIERRKVAIDNDESCSTVT